MTASWDRDTVPTTELPDARTCQLDPTMWEAPVNKRPTRDEWRRLDEARTFCHRCPALDPCGRYLAGWRFPDGVVAGRVFRDGAEIPRGRRAAA